MINTNKTKTLFVFRICAKLLFVLSIFAYPLVTEKLVARADMRDEMRERVINNEKLQACERELQDLLSRFPGQYDYSSGHVSALSNGNIYSMYSDAEFNPCRGNSEGLKYVGKIGEEFTDFGYRWLWVYEGNLLCSFKRSIEHPDSGVLKTCYRYSPPQTGRGRHWEEVYRKGS